MTYRSWLDEWVNVYKIPYLKADSVYRINTVIRKHIPEWLKDKELENIRALDLDKALAGCELSRTRKYMYYIFSNSLKKAYCIDLIPQNLTLKMQSVKHRTLHGRALTQTEQSEFLENLTKSKYKNLFTFYLLTGVRRQEALTLRWEDIDYQANEIYIHGTKTASSDRTLFLVPTIELILQSQKKLSGSNSLVFPYNKDNISHAFNKLCPKHKLHDLRHTFITRCAESGININVAQALAGHSDINTTLQIYTHVTTEFQRAEFNKYTLTHK